MPGYGVEGVYSQRVAFGPAVEAMSGLSDVMGYGPEEPRNTAMALMDPVAAQALQHAAVPSGPVNTTPDMMNDPQARERGFFVPIEPGPTPMPGNPIKMRGLSIADWTPCPKLGGDNAAVLRSWLDYSDGEIAELERAGVIVDRPPR